MRSTICATALAVCCVLSGQAKSADYRTEYDKKIKASQDIGALGDSLAGDQTNFYTGSTRFSATDISLPSNSMGLSLSRSYSVEFDRQMATVRGATVDKIVYSTRQRSFGDWDIDVPHISTVMTQAGGWAIDSTAPTSRCSVVGQVKPNGTPATGEPATVTSGVMLFQPEKYWSGYTLHAAGETQTLLVASLPNAERPSTGGPYHWTTNKDWWASCLTLSGGGEGFKVVSPDGTKYTFDKLTKRNVNEVHQRGELDPAGVGTRRFYRVYRAEYLMLASKVEDRFGNWTTYAWTNDAFARLSSMSTGTVGQTTPEQTINFVYDNTTGYITSASYAANAGDTKTWTYTYSGSTLATVTLPDTSKWTYGFHNLSGIPSPVPYCDWEVGTAEWWQYCMGNEVQSYGITAHVVHPSGARVDFTFGTHYQYSLSTLGSYPVGIQNKTMSGPGIASATWKYAHINGEFRGCNSTTCPKYKMADALAPDGSLRRKVFGLVPGQDETLLLGEFAGSTSGASAAGTPALTTTSRWGNAPISQPTPTNGANPTFYKAVDSWYTFPGQATTYTQKVGISPLMDNEFGSNGAYANERRFPVKKSVQTLQGVAFTSETDTFDIYGRPILATQASAGGSGGSHTRQQATTYHDATAAWVLGQVKSVTDTLTGKIIRRSTFNAANLPSANYAFEVLQHLLTYNADGTVATVTNGADKTTSVGNWYRGIPQSVLLPTAFTKSAQSNLAGWVISTTDELGYSTTYGYDPLGRLNRITYPTVDSTAWADTTRTFVQVFADVYGIPTGHWQQTVQTGNGVSKTFYNARWQPILVVTEDIGNAATRSFTVTRYDASGRSIFSSYPVATLTSVTDPLKGIHTSYDALGRVRGVTQDSELAGPLASLLTTTDYLSGFQKKVTSPRGQPGVATPAGFSTTTFYQIYDTPSTDAPVVITAPEGQTTVIDRQPSLGKPRAVTRNGYHGSNWLSVQRRYVYDAKERLCQTINPESGTTTVDYDAAGNISWTTEATAASGVDSSSCQTDRNNTALADRTVRTYDALNRVKLVATPGAVANVSTEYDPDGQVVRVRANNGANPVVVTDYTYNKRRLLTQEKLQVSPNIWYFDYAYNSNGHRSSQTYPGNLIVGYAPNALGQATQAGTFASGVTYHPNGGIKQFTYGNGIVHTMTPNSRNIPQRSYDAYVDPQTGATTKFIDDTYAYDANGNVDYMVDALPASLDNRSKDMGYDQLDRLLVADAPHQWGSATYTYDPIDNLRTASLGISAYNYNYDANNRLTTLVHNGGSTNTLTTDLVGNITGDARRGQTYQFDVAHRIAAVVGKEAYWYDGHGRRVRSANLVTGTVDLFGYSQSGQLMQDWSNRRGDRKAYIYLGGSLVATYGVRVLAPSGTAIQYQHTDALGSPVVVTDASRSVVSRTAYSPYGIPLTPVDGAGYAGHVIDQGTGLTYMQQRYYDPYLGRFLSSDPAESEFNRYSYARNNPYAFVDPDGRAAAGTNDSGDKTDPEPPKPPKPPCSAECMRMRGTSDGGQSRGATMFEMATAVFSVLAPQTSNANKKTNNPTKVPDEYAARQSVVNGTALTVALGGQVAPAAVVEGGGAAAGAGVRAAVSAPAQRAYYLALCSIGICVGKAPSHSFFRQLERKYEAVEGSVMEAKRKWQMIFD